MKNDIIKLLNSNGIIYQINSKSSKIEIPYVEEMPIISKRCSAYFCPSSVNANKKKNWKVELNGMFVKWVTTREEAQQLINLLEGK